MRPPCWPMWPYQSTAEWGTCVMRIYKTNTRAGSSVTGGNPQHPRMASADLRRARRVAYAAAPGPRAAHPHPSRSFHCQQTQPALKPIASQDAPNSTNWRAAVTTTPFFRFFANSSMGMAGLARRSLIAAFHNKCSCNRRWPLYLSARPVRFQCRCRDGKSALRSAYLHDFRAVFLLSSGRAAAA